MRLKIVKNALFFNLGSGRGNVFLLTPDRLKKAVTETLTIISKIFRMSGRRSSEKISLSKRKAFILVCLTGFTLGASIALISSPNHFGTATVSKVDSAQFDSLLDSVSSLENEIKKIKQERDVARKELRAATKKQAELLKQLDVKDDTDDASGEACLDRHAVWKPSAKRNVKDPDLSEVLEEVAVNNEVLVAVSNINYAAKGGMLDTWMDGVKRAGVKNALVIALDDQTKRNVEERGLHAFRMDLEIPETQKNAGSNHAVSSLKFRILQRFMKLGYSVLLSDVDVVTLDDPFKHLVRDSDVESMSDGYDQPTAYGYNDVFVRNHLLHDRVSSIDACFICLTFYCAG